MANFQNLKELTRTLYRGQVLLFDMFQKRKTLVSVRYDDALEVLGGDINNLNRMIKFGVLHQTGNTLTLDDIYREFFEEVLSVNEEINTSLVKTYIESLSVNIESYLASEPARQPQFMREIIRIFHKIDNATHRNVVDLKRNVDHTYRQEPNFKIKGLRLKSFDEKCLTITELIQQTEKMIEEQAIFFASAQDIALKETVAEVKIGLKESAHGLIGIKALIIDYLNRIQYQSRIVKKVRRLKYLRDQLLISESTNIKEVAAQENGVWLEPRISFITKVSVDDLHNADEALEILTNVRRRIDKKPAIRPDIAQAIDSEFLDNQEETARAFDHRQLAAAFSAQSADLFSFVWRYEFAVPVDKEERLVLFLQLASQFAEAMKFDERKATTEQYEYPLIYPQ